MPSSSRISGNIDANPDTPTADQTVRKLFLLKPDLTAEVEEGEYFAEVGDWEVVAVADRAGRNDEEPESVEKPELSWRPSILVLMERISLVLQKVDCPG